jgi:restriction endonuclease S subunit
MCLVSYNWNSLISTNLIKLSLNRNKIVPEFFIESMHFIKTSIKLKTWSENAFTHMNTWVLKNIEIILPPMEIQNKFIHLLNENNFTVKKQIHSLFFLEELYKTIIQDTFNY